MTCSRWLRANRVKSGMFNETVAQKPTVPLRAGIKNFRKSGNVVNLDGTDNIGPKPPAA